MGTDTTNHLIDFVVIFGADLLAAYFAIRLFEKTNANREQTERSLSHLYQLGNRLSGYYRQKVANKTGAADNFDTRIDGDLTDDRKDFEILNDDLLFWSFKSATLFKNKYESIRAKLALVHQDQKVRDLKINGSELQTLLKELILSIQNELKPKGFWRSLWPCCG